MTKSECTASLFTALTETSRWRLNIADRYNGDPRYARAARKLAKLASETPTLTDESWDALRPHFETARWRECVNQAARQVGFFHRKASFPFFLRILLRLLTEPATA